ncbi:MAG TPA: filamentous hemagglutinin N-terminal domain-containing protein, partial [Phormidium sp.]
MNNYPFRAFSLLPFALCLSLPIPAIAQISSDGSVPTTVTPGNNFTINGGLRTGSNLFHSFSEFSVPNGGSAYFNNAFDVQNIINRVTGTSISNIDGLLRANGTANLFLINPNGIIFGENSSLNIGGSFVATTANALRLANGDVFSSDRAQPLPSQILNVAPSALLFNQIA